MLLSDFFFKDHLKLIFMNTKKNYEEFEIFQDFYIKVHKDCVHLALQRDFMKTMNFSQNESNLSLKFFNFWCYFFTFNL